MVLAMKFELALTFLLFVLLFLKIDGRAGNVSVIRITNLFLLLNLAIGFFGNEAKEIFGGMFRTSALLAIEKSVLNLAVLLISFFSYDWLQLRGPGNLLDLRRE